jgi:phage terminase large subunit
MPTVTIDYCPRRAFLPFHNRTQRWTEMICHRRAGKTVAAINDLQKRALTCRLPYPRFAFMAPTRVRAKDIAWLYLKRFAKPIPGHRVIESELAVEYPNGARVTLYGSDNDRSMGLYLDGIVFDECDEIAPSVWDVVSPSLSDRQGWAVWMGILRGRHNLWKRYQANVDKPDHFQLTLRASDSGILPAEELERMQADMSEPAYLMQMECNPNASIATAIYGPEMDALRKDNRVRHLAIEQDVPLYAFWDIGHSDTGDDVAFWLLQMSGRDILIHRFFSRTGHPPAYYAAKIREFEAAMGDKRVEKHFLPHDGAQRNQVGKTYQNYLEDAGLKNIEIVQRTPDKWIGIQAMRVLLGKTYIDPRGCGDTWTLGDLEMPSGLDCLDYYHKKEDASTGLIRDVPVHDQYSHGADAIRTFAEAYQNGMLEGTSKTAQESRSGGPNGPVVVRGRWTPKEVRAQSTGRVIRGRW